MFGTLKWRLKEAADVFLGRKKTQPIKPATQFEQQEAGKLEPYQIKDPELKAFISSMDIEFCFSEFGENRVNAGGAEFSEKNRLEPSLSSLRKYFPNARYKVYSDFDLEIPGVTLNKVISSPVPDKEHPRYNYRMADYFKFKSLLESDADIVCVIDSDMFVFSEEIYSLIYLTQVFGFCAPYNPRNLLKRDMQISLDTGEINDQSKGYGHSYNQSPMTLRKNNEAAAVYFSKCCEIMVKEPSRASLVMWKAARETELSPYLLPQQWCVCAEDTGIGNEVLLHVGHPSVAEYYNIKL